MNVLIVHPPRTIQGGAEEVVDQLKDRLPKHGIWPTYITSRRVRGRVRDLYSLWREVNECVDWGSFDLVNCHNFPSTVAVWPACKRIPCVWMCNEPAELFTSAIRKPVEAFNRWVVSKYIKHVVVPDRASQIRVHGIYAGVETKMIPYGVDYEFYSRRNGEAKQDGFVMLHVGTISRWKNQIASLKLLNRVKEEIANACLVLAGYVAEPEYMAELLEYIESKRLTNRVVFTGHLSKEDMRRYYQTSDVLLHPAKQQGGWLAPFEAMAAGLTVVVWRSCLASLSITPDIGVVVDDHTATDKVIEDINHNPESYHVMAEKGREWVSENMTWDRYAKEMADYFKEVAGR